MAFTRLVPALFGAIERASAADKDHKDEVRLRNYAAFLDAMQPLASGASGGAGLDAHVQDAQAACDGARQGYVDDLISRSFGVPLELLARVDAALATGMAAEAVTFQPGLARTDVRRALKESLGARRAEKGVQEAHARCAKHFGKGSPLFDETWQAARETLLTRYARLEQLVSQLYGDALVPGAAELEELFATV